MRGHDPLPPERVVLHERLTPADIREVFAAINRDGKLDSLRPYFESASDGEMGAMADVLSHFFWEDAYRADSFAGLLRAESDRKGFSSWAAAAHRWETRPAFRDETAGLREVIALDSFPSLAKHDAGFLDPDWIATVITTWHRAGEYHERVKWPAPEPVGAPMFVSDLSHFLTATPNKTIADLAATFKASEFGTTVLKAAAAHGKAHGAAGFEGFSRTLSKMIAAGKPKNQLETLVNFARTLDGNSDGLFSQMSAKLADRELSRQISIYLRPRLVNGAASIMREAFVRLEQPDHLHGKNFWLTATMTAGRPTKAFTDLFLDLRESLDVATKPAARLDGEDESHGFIARAPVFLHAYALAKWVEHIVAENKEAFQRAPETSYGDKSWGLTVESKGFELKLADERDDKAVLTDATKTELTALGLGDFATALAATASQEKPGRFTYTFPAIEKKSLQAAFHDALLACDSARALANVSPAVVSLVYALTSSEAGSPFRLDDLESDNLLDSINHLLPKDYGSWTKLEALLFDELGIADLPAGLRDLVLAFYEGPRLKRATQILDSLATFREFDRPAAPGLPSGFAFYHRGISFCRAEEIHAPAALLSLFSDSKLFTPAEYPAVTRWVKNAGQVGKVGYALSVLPPAQRDAFLTPIGELFDATDAHLEVARAQIPKHARGLSSFFDAWGDAQFSPPTDRVTRAELRWLETFVREGGFEVFWSYFKNHGSRENLRGAVRELKMLSSKGTLADMFYMLGHINDERMKRLAASLAAWDASGELSATLDFFDVFLSVGTNKP